MIKSFALLLVFSIFSQTALPIFAQPTAAPSATGNSNNVNAVNDKIIRVDIWPYRTNGYGPDADAVFNHRGIIGTKLSAGESYFF